MSTQFPRFGSAFSGSVKVLTSGRKAEKYDQPVVVLTGVENQIKLYEKTSERLGVKHGEYVTLLQIGETPAIALAYEGAKGFKLANSKKAKGVGNILTGSDAYTYKLLGGEKGNENGVVFRMVDTPIRHAEINGGESDVYFLVPYDQYVPEMEEEIAALMSEGGSQTETETENKPKRGKKSEDNE